MPRRFLVISFILFILDRITKILALKLPAEGLFCSKEIFGINLYINKGIAFGIPLPQIISIILSVLILITLIHLLLKAKFNTFGLCLVIIGAFSNILDKLTYNGIIDFITIKYMPIFNIADVYIVIGLTIVIYSLKTLKKTSSS